MDEPLEQPPAQGVDCSMMIIGISVMILFIALILPPGRGAFDTAKLTAALANGKQIHHAIYTMAQDGVAGSNPSLGWPGDLAKLETGPVKDLASLVECLISYQYLDRGSVSKLFAGSGIPPYNGQRGFSAQNSAFKIYLVSEADADEVLFVATKNFTFSRGLQKEAKPFGLKGCVIVRKGGDGLVLSSKQALNGNIGYMPGHHSKEDPGEETSGNVWQ